MGNSSSNCFKSKDITSATNKMSKESQQCRPIINLKLWKQSLDSIGKKQIIQFNYPSHIVHRTFRNIDKDITRTYSECSFLGGNKINLEVFTQVLRKLAVYFPKIGYTQGMNFVAGFYLLCGLSLDETFSMCVKIFTNYDLMYLGLYQDYFPLNKFYCALGWEIVNARNPLIQKKINHFNIFDELWIFQWFTTLFIYSFPFEIISEIWTFLFIHKEFSCVRVASAFILLLWPYIEKCSCEIDFMNLMASLKYFKQFNKILKIKSVLEKAFEIKNQEIIQLIPQTGLETKNTYAQFFSLAENDRKIKYLQFLSELSLERQHFLKNSVTYKFERKESDIEVIDSIQINQAKMLYQSYTFKRNSNSTIQTANDKLWRSDVHKLTTIASKKAITQEADKKTSSNSNENTNTNVNMNTRRKNEDFAVVEFPNAQQKDKRILD